MVVNSVATPHTVRAARIYIAVGHWGKQEKGVEENNSGGTGHTTPTALHTHARALQGKSSMPLTRTMCVHTSHKG